MKLLNITFGILAILILLVGLFNTVFFLPCFGFGMLSAVFFILTAKIIDHKNKA